MRIQHNIMAMNAYRNYANNTSALSKNLEKLSSGYKINRAGDDAAGLAISEKMRAQITGLDKAQDNAKDGISLVQTAEGALTEVHDMLNRMYELAEQSANGTYQDEVDRENLQAEVKQLKDEIDRIADSSNFNGINLLDGSLGGSTNGDTQAVAGVNVTLTGVDSGVSVVFATNGTAGSETATWNGKTLTIALSGQASYDQDAIDNILKGASGAPEAAKNLEITVDGTITNNQTAATLTAADAKYASKSGTAAVTNKEGGSTTITVTANKSGDYDFKLSGTNTATAAEGATTSVDGNTVLNLDANKYYTASEINSMLAESGANVSISFDGELSGATIISTNGLNGNTGLTVENGAGAKTSGGLKLQIGDTSDSYNQLEVSIKDMHVAAMGLNSLDISNQTSAAAALDQIKDAINYVSGVRGTLGATQNRLDHTINNLSVMQENIQDAESSIRDTDVADEMMEYTKNNILIQSAQAMLAQANQVPQGVLQLLQ